MRPAYASDWRNLAACAVAAGLIVLFVGMWTRDTAAIKLGAGVCASGFAGLLAVYVWVPGGRRPRRRKAKW